VNPLMNPFAADMFCALSVNVNKVALLRNTRQLGIPSVVKAAEACLLAGAQGITVHPRPDERHIRPQDVHDLAQLMRQWPQAEYNLEGNPAHNLLALVEAVRPHQATFVPDSVGQSTSDHGYDWQRDGEALRPWIAQCKAWGVRVSLFMDPIPEAMAWAAQMGADRVELYTEPYAAAYGTPEQAEQVLRYASAAQAALAVGLGVNAGHDLNRANLSTFLRHVPGVHEVSIGHALVADALELGYAATVRDYLGCIRAAFAGASPVSGAQALRRP
jgi:pyridoxine 5-phosphate synthase